jgi:acyl-CoA reductase-like NAD-dependent aldehyde dehydrogenase
MPRYDKIFVGGQWIDASGGKKTAVLNPATEQVLAEVPLGTADDVDRAVSAAQAAFVDWSSTSAKERATALRAIAAELTRRREEIAALATAEVGTPIQLSRGAHAGLPINSFAFAADAIEQAGDDTYEEIGNSRVVREPYGVVGAITPWNYPMHQSAAKIAPALAAGNTVVYKPSEVAPLATWVLAEIIASAGLPAGAFNLVSGDGAVVGHRIAEHPGVDLVSFTGSTAAGVDVSHAAAESVKRVSLELGGKGPAVLLPGVALATAVPQALAQAFLNSGQTCLALTRLLVHSSQIDAAETVIGQTVDRYVVGDPTAECTTHGPLTSTVQRDRVLGYIHRGIAEGANLLVGGPETPTGLNVGFYVQPTVFTRVRPDSALVREEIFGPVLVVQVYETVDEAVELANGTDYGLSAGVWAPDQESALAVGRRIRAGQVQINNGAFNPNAPFGGYKRSGNGREYGHYGLEEFQEIKSFHL